MAANAPVEFVSLRRRQAALGLTRLRVRLRPRRRLRPLRRWFLASVRARTTALSMLVVAAALGVCAYNLVVIVSRSLVRNVDETNLTRAEDVAARARAGVLGRVIPVSGGGNDKSVFIQVVDQAGSVVASSENYLEPNAFIYVYPEEGSQHRILVQTTVHGPPIAPRASFRVVVLTGQTPTGPANVIVGTEMDQAEDTVSDLRRALAYGVPGVLALAGLLIWLLVGKALRPVELIRSQVAAISDTASLDRRVGESPVDDEIGRLAQTMNAMLDRLQRSAERQRRFVADASHELRSPLASTRAQLEVVLSHPHLDPADWEATAEDLLSENQRMERLVNDLLFLARNEERPAGLAGAAPLDLDDIVLSEAGRLRTRGQVQVDISRVTAGRVRGIEDHLTRVVRNLVENAERHATSSVRLEIRRVHANGRGPQIQLAVSDDGPGVPPEHREHIFDRFIRLDDARCRPNGDGNGGVRPRPGHLPGDRDGPRRPHLGRRSPRGRGPLRRPDPRRAELRVDELRFLGRSAFGQAAGDRLQAGHERQHPGPGLFGLGRQTLHLLQLPVADHARHQDLVVVQGEVVDPGPSDRRRPGGEVVDARPRHLEVLHLPLDGQHHGRRIHGDGLGHQVPVEQVVEVLVGSDAGHDLVAHRIADELAGVAVRHPGGQFLERHVDERVDRRGGLGHDRPRHLRHPAPLQLHRVERPGHRQVVADHDRVALLLGCPAADPLAPHPRTEHVVDRVEVVGQIVLGQEVDEEGVPHRAGYGELLRVPFLLGLEVTAPAPWHVQMGEPFLGGRDVAFHELLSRRHELMDEAKFVRGSGARRHIAISLPTRR